VIFRVVAIPATVIVGWATPALTGVMTYPVIVALPFAGATHERVALAAPTVACTPVGTPGRLGEPTLTVVDAAGPAPLTFAAETVNV
jgi:hypothetical protein